MERLTRYALLLAFPALFGVLAFFASGRAETALRVDPPVRDIAAANDVMQVAVIAGGCFWGVQAVYQHVNGVANAVSGYAGGAKEDADYRSVSSGRTGHAEAVQVTFDPKVVSYGQILQIFFSVAHDPTQLDRQGPDVGPHYRSEIFAQNEAQREIAKAYVAQLDAAKAFPRPIVTRLDATDTAFYPAEDYHQDYALRHPRQLYIVINDAPKVENLKKLFPELWREKPVTVAETNAKASMR